VTHGAVADPEVGAFGSVQRRSCAPSPLPAVSRCLAFAIAPDRSGSQSVPPSITDVELVARGVRGAIMRHAEDARAPELSGHDASGAPLDGSHLGVCPIPAQVGSASAATIGAVVVRVSGRAQVVLGGLARWQRAGMRLVLGRLGAWRLVWLDEASAGWRAMAAAIVGPSQRWVTLTPVALDRNPGNLFASDGEKRRAAWAHAEATIGEACVRAGLPRPVRVRASSEAWSAGVPRAGRFMPYPRDGRKAGRVCVHAAIEFAEAVAGPVVVGAGRYFGMGTLVGAIDAERIGGVQWP